MPSQQIVPEHVGLKALYGLQQIVQQWPQQRWKKKVADARPLDIASRPRPQHGDCQEFLHRQVGWF
jgi:hypothetical protein